MGERRVEVLERELEAARRTLAALAARVEELDAGPPDDADALVRALAGARQALAQRTQTLLESEATWRALYESTPDPLLTVDGAGVVVACNRTANQWLDPTGEGLHGRPLAALLARESAADLAGLIDRGWRGAAEQRLTLADGRRITLNAVPIPGALDRRHHVTVRDVTTREAIDGMADEVRRMDALAELAGGLARELNAPMAIVQGRIELLLALGAGDPATVERHLEVALGHARRITATLQSLHLVGRAPLTHLERVFVLDAWAIARTHAGPALGAVEVVVRVEPDDLAVGGSEPILGRVLANLAERVGGVAGRGARLEVHARARKGEVEIRLLAGAPPARRSRMVVPPPVDEAPLDDGSLAIGLAKALVRSVGGRLELRSAGRRAMATIGLPAAPIVRPRAKPVEGRVLAVGPPAFVAGVREALGRDGFAVDGVADADAALAALATRPEVDGVIASLLLPGASGVALLEDVARRHPHLAPRLVVAADAALVAPAPVRVVRVPLRRDDLLTVFRGA